MSGDGRPPRFRLPFARRRSAVAEGERFFRVSTGFESGSIGDVEVSSASHLRFAARADSSPRPLWFYFCIEGARVPSVRCDLLNADACLGPRHGWRTARPVFSADGRQWQRVERTNYVEVSSQSGFFDFVVPIVGPRTYVAYCYPYTAADLGRVLTDLPPAPEIRVEELCRSLDDRSVPVVQVGPRETAERSVWVLARQHAGETPASYTAEGLLRWLTGVDGLGSLSLATTSYHVVPMVDVDGVASGAYGKDQAPVDFNRDWSAGARLPQIVTLVERLRALRDEAPPTIVVDIHASHHGDTSCYLFLPPPDGPAALRDSSVRLAQLVAEECPSTIGMQASSVRAEAAPEGSAREFLTRMLAAPVVTLEMSYHLAQSGRYLTPEDYRQAGAALARALDRYSRNSTE